MKLFFLRGFEKRKLKMPAIVFDHQFKLLNRIWIGQCQRLAVGRLLLLNQLQLIRLTTNQRLALEFKIFQRS